MKSFFLVGFVQIMSCTVFAVSGGTKTPTEYAWSVASKKSVLHQVPLAGLEGARSFRVTWSVEYKVETHPLIGTVSGATLQSRIESLDRPGLVAKGPKVSVGVGVFGDFTEEIQVTLEGSAELHDLLQLSSLVSGDIVAQAQADLRTEIKTYPKMTEVLESIDYCNVTGNIAATFTGTSATRFIEFQNQLTSILGTLNLGSKPLNIFPEVLNPYKIEVFFESLAPANPIPVHTNPEVCVQFAKDLATQAASR